MAWDTDYALEGIFSHGGPLNVHQYEIDSGKFGAVDRNLSRDPFPDR